MIWSAQVVLAFLGKKSWVFLPMNSSTQPKVCFMASIVGKGNIAIAGEEA